MLAVDAGDDVVVGDVGDNANVDGVRVALDDRPIELPVVPLGELSDPAIGDVAVPGVVGVIPRFDPIAGVDGGGNDEVNEPEGKSCDDALDVVEGMAENVDAGGGGDVSGGVKKIEPLGAAVDGPENALGVHGGGDV